MTSSVATPEVSCIVFLPDRSTATPYAITVKEGAKVQDLLAEIRRFPDLTIALMNERATLYQCGALAVEPTDCDDPADKRYKETIEWLRVEDNIKKKVMNPLLPLEKYFESGFATFREDKIDVIVVTDSILEYLSSNLAVLGIPVNTPYLDELSFKIKRESEAIIPTWHSVVYLNDYVNSVLPDFIKTVIDTPRRAANDLDKATAEKLFQCIKDKCRSAPSLDISALLPKLYSDADNARPYARDHPEVYHYVAAFYYVIAQQTSLAPDSNETPDRLTFNEANSFVFSHFQLYWDRQVNKGRCAYDKDFPFFLIAKEQVESTVMDRKYLPHPDVVFYKGKFPYFLAEVDSLDNENDKYRLYVHMACALKYALALRQKDGKDNKFFLMGAFFSKEWEIHRYFFYIDDVKKTCFNERKFKMNNASELMTFLYEFYTYASHVKENDTGDFDKVTEQIIAVMVDYAKKKGLKSLYWTRGKKHARSRAGQDNINHDQSQGSNVRTAITDALRRSRFQVQYYEDPEEYGPLIELPAHVVEATSPDGKLVIAKLTRKNSNELSLLQELSSQKSPHNHVIPLLDTVPSHLGRLIILPFETQLSSYSFPWDRFEGRSVQLSRELIEGIAFLHRRKIAHLDIKPGNLVYSFEFQRLYIIDFDLAMRCKDVDEMVELSCGTPGWSAPEIVHGDKKPLSVFSPIRADLWSCGKVLWSIRRRTNEEDSDIARLTFLLIDSEPTRRPLLHEVVDEEPDFWTSGRPLQALNSRVCDDKSQPMSVNSLTKLKRAHDDTSQASRESSVSKVLRKDGNFTVRSSSASSFSS